MSITVSNPTQICNSPVNYSKSKMLYSFSKANRLPPLKAATCNQAFYSLPSIKHNRTTSLGFGQKFDFTKGKDPVPAPNTYSLSDQFKAHRKGFSFGAGRDSLKANNSFLGTDRRTPGPGAYESREKYRSNVSFTLKGRTKNPAEISSSIKTPGPGSYRPIEVMSPQGKYAVSRFKNSGATLFPPSRSGRFTNTLNRDKSPGPGSYNSSPGTSPNGSYMASNYRSSQGKSFGASFKNSSPKGNLPTTPGPGYYRLPSEFGYYEAATYHKSSVKLH